MKPRLKIESGAQIDSSIRPYDQAENYLVTLQFSIKNLECQKDFMSPKNLQFIRDGIAKIENVVEDKFRSTLAFTQKIPKIWSFEGGETLRISIMDSRAPWRKESISNFVTPGMITEEEKKYYQYLGKFFEGQGEVVELGPWLGASTRSIVQGLKENPNFAGKKVNVFDDFIWRSYWMNKYVNKAEQLQNHADFQLLFEKYSADILPLLDVHKRKIADYDGNQAIKQLEWNNEPIELIFIDCGRTYEANEGWHKIFKNSFISNRTIIVMQDWRLHREVPRKWYNQTKLFTDSKGSALQLIHEVSNGRLASFLYTG